jgi:hypothetical protein
MTRVDSCTIELDIVGPASSIKDLDANFAFHEARGVHTNDSEYTFDNLPAHNCWFGEATTHDEYVATKALLPKDVFCVSNEVPISVST